LKAFLYTNLFIGLLIPFASLAQLPAPKSITNGMVISSNIHYGSIIKHTKKMSHFTYGSSWGVELNISKKTNGSKYWHHIYNYPAIGVSFLYVNFGNPALLGNAFAVYPKVNISLFERKNIALQLKVGTGLAYIPTHYDILDNPSNNAIGSSLNNITVFGFGMAWKVQRHTYLFLDGTFKHYSNAAFKAPDLGLNIPALSVGVKHLLTEPENFVINDSIPEKDKKLHVRFNAGLAMAEYRLPGGPRYPVYISQINFSRFISITNALTTGLLFAYHTNVYDFIINNEVFLNEPNLRWKAVKVGFEFGDEIFFGNLSMGGIIGIYIYNPFFMPSRIYNRVYMNYYFLNKLLFAGIYLKTHYGTADYLAVCFGVSL